MTNPSYQWYTSSIFQKNGCETTMEPHSHGPMRPAAQVSLKEMQLDTVLNCAKSKVARQGDDTWTKHWQFFLKNWGMYPLNLA